MNIIGLKLNLQWQNLKTILLGSRLPETENTRCQISLLKNVVAVIQEIFLVVACEKVCETVFYWKTKRLFTKWCFAGSGRLQDCSR